MENFQIFEVDNNKNKSAIWIKKQIKKKLEIEGLYLVPPGLMFSCTYEYDLADVKETGTYRKIVDAFEDMPSQYYNVLIPKAKKQENKLVHEFGDNVNISEEPLYSPNYICAMPEQKLISSIDKYFSNLFNQRRTILVLTYKSSELIKHECGLTSDNKSPIDIPIRELINIAHPIYKFKKNPLEAIVCGFEVTL